MVVLTSVTVFCFSLFAFADDVSTTTQLTSAEQEVLVGSAQGDDVQIHCVWTSCAGTYCDDTLADADQEFLVEYMEAFDQCYD